MSRQAVYHGEIPLSRPFSRSTGPLVHTLRLSPGPLANRSTKRRAKAYAFDSALVFRRRRMAAAARARAPIAKP